MSNVTEQLFTNAFNAGVRYAEEPDADTRLSRLAKDRTEFGEIAARLLALLAPEPEPSDAEIEAGAKALCRLAWGDAERTMSAESWAVYRDRAKVALLAARAARQTGGE